MSEFEIQCVNQKDGVIVSVGSGGKTYNVQDIVDWLEKDKKQNSCYTYKDGKKAQVVARKHHTGKWYLTTNPDDTKMNNLDFLKSCN